MKTQVEIILDILREDPRIIALVTAANGAKLFFRSTTLIIEAITPEGLIHAVVPMPKEEYTREVLCKILENKPITSFFSVYLEYDSYGVGLPEGNMMSLDQIRDLVYLILFSHSDPCAALSPAQIRFYSVIAGVSAAATHLNYVERLNAAIA